MLKTSTISMKLVPHRGWIVLCFAKFSCVRSRFASNVLITLCSAPWYSKTRRMSFIKDIPAT